MDIYEIYSTDPKKEAEGVWQKIGGGAELLVARAGNRNYDRRIAALYEENRDALRSTDKAAVEALDLKMMTQVEAETVLLGWKNIQFKGAELPYSVENAVMLLQVKDFRKLVDGLSTKIDHYRSVVEAEVGKP